MRDGAGPARNCCPAPAGAVVGIWIPGEGGYVATRGVSDVRTKQPMRIDDHFRIGSITKTFTATLLLMLADEKRLGLDDPVSKYVAWVPNGDRITLRMLADMTSGLHNYTEDDAWVKTAFSNFNRSALYGLAGTPPPRRIATDAQGSPKAQSRTRNRTPASPRARPERRSAVAIIVASQGRTPAWLATSSARPSRGTCSVPVAVTRTHGSDRVYPRVVNRLQTFFVDGNETNVRSAAIFGY